jgi:WD40 repeat protein
MNALVKYLLFVVSLVAVVGMAANRDLFYANPFSGSAKTGKRSAGEIPSLPLSPSQVLAGVRSTGAIDYHSGNRLTATGEEGRIRLWQLPDEKPVLEIDAGEGFQVLQVRFVPGKETIAGCGPMSDGKGSIRIFDIATGKQTLQIDDQEPVVYIDFDQSGRYLVFTGMSTIKVWDLAEKQAVSVIPGNGAGGRGVFFMEDRYILLSDPLSLYDWKNRKMAATLGDTVTVGVKRISADLCAWMSSNGLYLFRSPYGKKEFIPFNTQGIYSFDLAPDGRWGLFLKEDKTMSLVDCATGLAVRTLVCTLRPDAVSISHDGASAFLLYRAGKIEVFDVGNENIFRNARFYTARFFSRLWNKAVDAEKGVPLARNPVN